MEVLYQEMYKMKRVEARKRLVRTYREIKSIRKTAKLWGRGSNSFSLYIFNISDCRRFQLRFIWGPEIQNED